MLVLPVFDSKMYLCHLLWSGGKGEKLLTNKNIIGTSVVCIGALNLKHNPFTF